MATLQQIARIALQGGTETKRQLEEVAKGGDAAKKAFDQMAEAGKKVPPGLRAIDAAAESVKGNLQAVGSSLGPLGASLASLGPAGIAAAAGIGALGKVFTDSVRFQREFEKGLANLSAITGASGKDLEYLKNQALELGKSTTSSATATVEAFKLIASAKPELLANREALAAVTKEAIALAEASGTTVPEAAKLLTTSLNQFGVGADQASRFINVLAAGVKFGAAEIPDLAVALVKAGTEAKGAGLSFEQFNAILQKLAAFGTPAEKIGTSLRNIFLKLQEGAANTNPAVVGVTQALQNLAAQQLTVTQLTDQFGTENVTVVQQLIQVAGGLDEFTNQITATSEAYAQQATNTDTLDGALTRLGGAYDALKAQIAGNQSALRDFIDILAAGVAGTANAIEGARRYGEALQFVDPLVQAYGSSLADASENLDTVHLQSTELAASTTTLAEQIGFASSAMYSEVAALQALWSEADTATDSFKELQKAQAAARKAADSSIVEKELEVAANKEADKLGLDEPGRLRLITQWKRELAGATAAQAAEEARLQKILDDQAGTRKKTTDAEREGQAARKKAAAEAERAAEQATKAHEQGLDAVRKLENEARTAGLEGIEEVEARREVAYQEFARLAEEANLTQEEAARGYVAIWEKADKEITEHRETEAEKQAEVARRAYDKQTREAERQLDRVRRDQEQLADTVGDAFGDVLVGFVEDGKVEFDDLWRGFLTTGLRAIAQLAAQSLIINVGVNATGLGGATGGALGQGSGLLQAGQSLFGLGKTLYGGFNSLTDALGFTTSATEGLTSEVAYLANNGIDVAGLTGSNIAGPVAPASEQFAGTAAGSASGLLLIPGLGLVSANMFDAAFGQGRFQASGGQLLNFAGGTIAGSAAIGATIGAGYAIGTTSATGIAGVAGAAGSGAVGGAAVGGIAGIVLAAAGVIGLAIAKNLGAFKGPTGGTVARGAFSGFLTNPDNGIPYFVGEDFYNDRGQAEATSYARAFPDDFERMPGDQGFQFFNTVKFSDWLREEQRRHPETWRRDLEDDYWSRLDDSGNVLPGQDFLFGGDPTRNRRANDPFYLGLERYVGEQADKIGLNQDQLNIATGLTAGFRVNLGEDIDLQQPSRQMALLASLLGNINDLGLDAAQAMEVFQAAAAQLGPGQNVIKGLNDFFTSQDNDLSVEVYRDSIQGLAQIYFNDLPRGVNASKIALKELNEAQDEFGQQGTVSFNQLKEQIGAAVAEAEALEPAFQQAFAAGLFDVELDEIEFADSIFDSLYEALKSKIADAAYEGLVDGIFTGDILGPFLKTFSETTAKVKSGEITQDEASVILANAAKDARDNLELLRPMIVQAVESGRDLAAVFDELADSGDDAAESLKDAFNQGIDRQILNILSPDLAAQYDLEVTQRNRLKAAREAGADLSKVEFLNGLEREALAEQQAERLLEIERNADEQIARIREQFFAQAERAIEQVADKFKAFTQTPSAAVTPEAALAAAQAEFDRLAAAARGGDLEAISDLPAAADTLAALITSLFGSTGQAAALLEPLFATLQEIAGLDPGAVKLSADAQAQIDAINADRDAQLAQQEKHHAVAVAIYEAMLADLDKLVGKGGETPADQGTLKGDHITKGVPGPEGPAPNGPSSGRYGLGAIEQGNLKGVLASATPGGDISTALVAMLQADAGFDNSNYGQLLRTMFPGASSLAGQEAVLDAIIRKIEKPDEFSPVLGFATGGSFRLGGSGGADSIPLLSNVRVSPRETVTVTTHGMDAKLSEVVAELRASRQLHQQALARMSAMEGELAALRVQQQRAQDRRAALGARA